MAWVLLAKCGGQTGVHWDITAGPVVLGEGAGNAIVVNDPDVDHPQCRLFTDAEEVYIEEIGARGGLVVNGEAVCRACLSPGDTIALGNAVFTVSRLAGAADPVAGRMIDEALVDLDSPYPRYLTRKSPSVTPIPLDLAKEAHAYVKTIKESLPPPTTHAPGAPADTATPEEPPSPLLGQSRAMQDIRTLIRRVAPTPLAVLISGETGTGKELAAEMLHAHSTRASGPFIAVNCAAIPEQLFESELFGHEKGAFTSADRKRKGKIALAHGGTLFLDEIGELTKENQARLLRVLEKGVYYPVGAEQESRSSFRLLTATNRNLQQAIEQGELRRDLYHRICAMEVYLPPLRERPSDIRLLAQYFSTQTAQELGTAPPEVTEEVLNHLIEHPWPGNVRELKNCLERAVALVQGNLIQLGDLVVPQALSFHSSLFTLHSSANATLAEVERVHIARVLDVCEGNVSKAARLLGVHRNTLHNRSNA